MIQYILASLRSLDVFSLRKKKLEATEYALTTCENAYMSGSPSETIHFVGKRRFLHPGYRNASSGMKTLVINVNSSFKVQIQENCKID